MRHIEFIHNDHFENNYHRVPPPLSLAGLIDFFWETKFEQLWEEYPKGFSDAQFPNVGYTYIINLGSPCMMQVENQRANFKTDGFLPRYHAFESFHKTGNHLFGIKFRISPVIFEKKIDFSEYKGYIYPLSYLLDARIIESIKSARLFEERTSVLSKYFLSLVNRHEDSMAPVKVVSDLLDHVFQKNDFNLSLDDAAANLGISARTLQRYFETCTGIGGKQAFQVMRIRKAVTEIINSGKEFDYKKFGYYDYSHFHKHLKSFLSKNTFGAKNLHLELMKREEN